MDKMAQWKASILGINKTGHGGPSKGKHPTHAPMAKFAMGGKVVKKADGGKVSFGAAFAAARKAMENGNGGKTFTWNGKSYSTRKKEETPAAFKKMDFGGQKYISDKAGLDKDPMLQRAARESDLAARVKEESDYNERNDAEERARSEYQGYKKGGQVKSIKFGSKKVQAHADEAQDKILFGKMMKAENKKEKMGFALKKGGKVKKKYADGGSVRAQGNMKRPQFSASKSFDGGNNRVGLSVGKGNVRASLSKKFADGGAVTKLANEASGVINEMTKNRVPMKKGGKVKKAC